MPYPASINISPVPAPRTLVLGYFTHLSAPTRARRVTAWVLLVLAAVDAVLTVIGGILTVYAMIDEVNYRFGHSFLPHAYAAMSPTWSDWMQAFYSVSGDNVGEFIVPLMGFVVSLVLSLCFNGVRHGRRLACYAALGPVLLNMGFFLLCCAMLVCVAVATLISYPVSPWWAILLELIFGITFGLAALLMFDLCAYLAWIARVPAADPPPRPFV